MLRITILFVLLFANSKLYANSKTDNINIAEKILKITVDETGIIKVGRDTISSDNLARYIQERLFKSFMGTGHMHNLIKFEKLNENVPEMVAEVVLKEIKEGQKRALTELSLQKYKKLFDNLDINKQKKIKKQFPVLFQTEF